MSALQAESERLTLPPARPPFIQTTSKAKKQRLGERYKPGELTAASNKLPIGSKVVVKNRKTGKKVTVRINDHMAKNAKSHIDLSKGAANKLGIRGTAPIDAKVISK
jgi:rare lipoprotein A